MSERKRDDRVFGVKCPELGPGLHDMVPADRERALERERARFEADAVIARADQRALVEGIKEALGAPDDLPPFVEDVLRRALQSAAPQNPSVFLPDDAPPTEERIAPNTGSQHVYHVDPTKTRGREVWWALHKLAERRRTDG